MLSANGVLPTHANTRSNAPSTCVHRLVQLLRAARAIPAEAVALDREFRWYCTGMPATDHGFAWDAPVYEAPDSLKDTLRMRQPARETNAASAEPPADAFRWRRHPALLRMMAESSLPDDQRLARLAAVRGVLAARNGDLDAAHAHFLEAAREPTIRFQVVPGFWGCSRGGMNAAVAAYEAAGRVRDAAALAATIRTRYRPRAVQAIREQPAPGPGATRRPDRREPSAGTGD
ncbi:MAG TPA: hypothetical protein VNP95_03505 [Thermomicrobiales bacterium]|nr:hypothetical protein [Thermomicrobiales bacterium]